MLLSGSASNGKPQLPASDPSQVVAVVELKTGTSWCFMCVAFWWDVTPQELLAVALQAAQQAVRRNVTRVFSRHPLG